LSVASRFFRAAAQRPLYPWLLATYPIALIAALNSSQVSGDVVLWALAAGLVAASVCVIGYRLVLGSWHRAAFCAAITVILFYGFAPTSMGAELAGISISPLLFSALWLLLLAVGVLRVCSAAESRIARLSRPFNLVAGFLVASAAAQGISSEIGRNSLRAVESTAVQTHVTTGSLPDIYYIILDGYARADVLEKYYGHDNSPFLDALRSRGFAINERGYANYYWTFLSLASSLNMGYVPEIFGGTPHPNSADQGFAFERIRNNAVAQTLRGEGYRFVQLQSTWGATLSNAHADTFVSCETGLLAIEFYRTLAEASWLRVFTGHASTTLADCHTRNFQSLADLAPEPGPKFVLAHFVLPHYPYVFDRHGNVLRDSTIASDFDFQARLWEKRDSYLEQLLYVNDTVLATIARIQERSARPPVIVVQSDHGPQLGLPELEERRARLANLAAFHLPDAPSGLIPQGDSPVNFFRRILSFYLDAELPPLDNRHYYSSFHRPYVLEDVTAILAADVPHVISAAPQ
jgi:hypothetical protein